MKNLVWSASRLKTAEHCLAWYFYRYHHKDKRKIPTTPPLVFGNLFHSLMERFYNEDGTPFYKSEDSFSGAAVGQWLHVYTKEGKDNRGNKIDWFFEGQKYAIIPEIKDVAKQIYQTYSDPERPRPAKQEYDMRVSLDGLLLRGTMDAIFGYREETGLIGTDYKTDRFPPGKDRLEYDPQFGFYLLLMGIALKQNPILRRELNFPEEEAEKLSIENLFLSEKINIGYDHLRTGQTVPISRSEEDIQKILISIRDRKEQILTNNFIRSPGKHCVRCQRRELCDSDTKNEVKLELPDNKQIELFPPTKRIKKSRKRPQKVIKFPKDKE